jgi:hypothetical protein
VSFFGKCGHQGGSGSSSTYGAQGELATRMAVTTQVRARVYQAQVFGGVT